MKLRTRLALLSGVVFIAGGGAIGGSSALIARQESIDAVDAVLGEAIASVRNDPLQDISAVLDAADSSPVPISAMLFFDDSEPVVLVESRDGDETIKLPTLSITDVTRAAEKPITNSGAVKLRIATYSTGNGEWLVVGASLSSTDDQFGKSLVRTMRLSLLIALFMVILVYWLILRALRPIVRVTRDAQAIAEGDLDRELTTDVGTSEIGLLTNSLLAMVNTLRLAVQRTSRSEALMREFLGDASHELRTPLTVIRGYIDILNSGQELSEEQRERAMSRLVSESQRMSQTINDLLLLAELGEVRHEMSETVDLSALVANHVRDFSDQHNNRTVKSAIASDVKVVGNTEQLSRMISNVLSNILRHTPPDAEVDIILSKIDQMAVVVFDDAGPGLSTELYARTKEGFQRFDRAHSKTGGGFGLGLSIISSIVQRHGGTLSLSPSPLGGLRTHITLKAS
ncbi:MAG: ATP-binding protein [Actinomycetes bacterium]